MRHDATFVVKRLAPPIGRPAGRRRIVIACRALTLDDAIANALDVGRRRMALETMRTREGDPHGWITNTLEVLKRTAIWIESRDAPATRKPSRRRGEGAP